MSVCDAADVLLWGQPMTGRELLTRAQNNKDRIRHNGANTGNRKGNKEVKERHNREERGALQTRDRVLGPPMALPPTRYTACREESLFNLRSCIDIG
jgi:hypothetical protein